MSAAKHPPMVVAAARTMCSLQSEACGVDEDDLWKVCGEELLDDAQKVLEAAGAPEILRALKVTVETLAALGDHVNLQRIGLEAIAKAGVTP